ncbi:nicotinamidase, partial [Streptomyces sp. WAC 06725]
MPAAIPDLDGQAAGIGYCHVVATCDHHIDPGVHFSVLPDCEPSCHTTSFAVTSGTAFPS